MERKIKLTVFEHQGKAYLRIIGDNSINKVIEIEPNDVEHLLELHLVEHEMPLPDPLGEAGVVCMPTIALQSDRRDKQIAEAIVKQLNNSDELLP